jgi:hypothetical protein
MTQESRRSVTRWWLVALTTILTLMQLGTMVLTATVPDALVRQISLLLPLEFIAAAVWALIFAYVTVNLIRTKQGRPALWALLGFVTYSTVRLFIFSQADYDQGRIAWLVLANLPTLALVYFLRR